MNIFEKIKFIFKKPKVVIVTGEGRACVKEAIFQVLKQYFNVGKEILIFDSDLENTEEFNFLIKNSSLPILVVSHISDIPSDKDFFAGDREKTAEIQKIAKAMPASGFLVLNFDDEMFRELNTLTNLKTLTFGFQEGADFRVSDVKLNHGTNFKINYKGNIVPVWLEKVFGKKQIYSALAATCVGTIFDLNLVEISQALKNYQSLPGKMRLIEGIKHSFILDDSEGATVFSMVEALEILGKIEWVHSPKFQGNLGGQGRKVAVLGDVFGVEKCTAEAHEAIAIGERAAKSADLLFTFGQRAKFIAQVAQNKGMAIEKIFQFDTIDEGKLKLQDEIKEGDLILVDGSKEMEMQKIIEEIRAQ